MNKSILFKIALLLTTTSVLSGCGSRPGVTGIIGVSRSTYSSGVKEEVELHSDGTYRQKITGPEGEIYQHSGKWEKYTEKAGLPGVPSDGSQIQLKGHAEATDVLSKKSVEKAEKIDLITPGFSFQKPRVK